MKNKKPVYDVIGIMSGTSLDGLDLCSCTFSKTGSKWEFEINAAETIAYTKEWKNKLSSLINADAYTFCKTDNEFGKFIGYHAHRFIKKHRLKPGLISSHGHTVFHRPELGFTTQIGNGAAIAAQTGIRTVCDFRSTDVAYNGQGAPLVPIGDQLLFSEYDFCLNLGGIANISFAKNRKRIAFDVCPANMALNYLAEKLNKPYDKNGLIAFTGKTDQGLLNQLNGLGYYKKAPPKSMGAEWFNSHFKPLLDKSSLPVKDKMRTVCEHIAMQVNRVITSAAGDSMMASGGGVKNNCIVDALGRICRLNIYYLNDTLTDYKEALIFALLGILKEREEINTLKSVTGAMADNTGGAIYLPAKLNRKKG